MPLQLAFSLHSSNVNTYFIFIDMYVTQSNSFFFYSFYSIHKIGNKEKLIRNLSECNPFDIFTQNKLLHIVWWYISQAEIEALLSQVCTILPDALKPECQALVGQYGPLLVQFLVNELQPDQVCKTLGLCSTTKGEWASKH